MKNFIGSFMLAFLVTSLATSLVTSLAALPKKRYDERGNPISSNASATAAPQVATTESKGQGATRPTQVSPASSAVNPTTPEATSPTEEAEGAEEAALANPLTKVYLENARLYLRSERLDKALEFLKKSQEAGEDPFSQEARLLSLTLRAGRGDTDIFQEADAFDEKLKNQALLRLARGYDTCMHRMSKKPHCASEAERIYAYLSELSPSSTEGKLASLALGQLLLDAGRAEAALPHLVSVLQNEKRAPQGMRQIPYDRGWMQLARLYERPWYHRDVHKAVHAYKQVLKYADSPYTAEAKERIEYLMRFGTGVTLP